MTDTGLNSDIKPNIFAFIKFYERKEYANQFVAGQIFCNRVSYYKDNSSNDLDRRSDTDEGTSLWLQPGRGQLILNGVDLSNDLAAPVKMQKHWINHLHLFCMYTVHTGNLTGESLSDISMLRQQLVIPDPCFALGEYAVLVKDVNEFARRMIHAAGQKGYRIAHNRVNYFDPTTYHGQVDDIDSIFRKPNQYSFQREYRFLIDSNSSGKDPVYLDIGGHLSKPH